MSKSTHQFEVRGVDKSGGAFKSIKGRAATTSAQIRSMVGGAISALGAYMGFRAIKGGIDELGHLSDIAQKTSTNVGELTQTVAAMSALGIQNMGVDQLGKAFDYMAKTTGRTGMAGFYQTIDELGKIPDAAKRGQAAMQIFGRSGMEFMPLINAADESVNALRTVVAAMPKVPQSAAKAADGASDAMGFAANQVKSIWLQGLGFLANKLNNDYTGDVRTAALTAGNYLEYYTKVAVAKCISWVQKFKNAWRAIGQAAGALVGGAWEKTFGTGGSWSDVWKGTVDAWNQGLQEYSDAAKEIDKIEDARTARFLKNYEDKKIAIKHFAEAYDAAAISIGKRNELDGAKELDVGKQTRISNDLILGGSNAATRLQLIGPTLQSEQKRTNELLEKVVENTAKTADNTEENSTESFHTLDT